MTDYYGEEANKKIVSAIEKRIIASKRKREYEQISSSKAAITFVYFVSILLAFILTQGPLVQGVNVAFGIGLDPYLFGPGNPDLTGSPSLDAIIAIIIRGTFIFGLAGFIPMVTLVWQLILKKDHLNGYVCTWATTVLVMIAAYYGRETIAGFFY